MTTNITNVFSGRRDVKVGKMIFIHTDYNDTDVTYPMSNFGFLGKLIYSLIILICIPGIIGNVIVIRFLGFQMKRNPFNVYIHNLAVADSGTLMFLFMTAILYIITEELFIEISECLVCTYCAGQFLLTIISIDWCLAIFFPIWHRCHQPPYLPTMLCGITWMVSVLFCAIHYTLILVKKHRNFLLFYHIFIYITVCIPLMVVSSLALYVKGYLKSRMQRRRKLLTAILLALFFFLIFSFPPITLYLINLISNQRYFYLFVYGYLCASLSSSVNPLIYFLLGRKKELHSVYNLKIILQRDFKEEEENEEPQDVQLDV